MLNAEDLALLDPIALGNHQVPGLWRYMMPEEVLYFRVDAEARSSCFQCPKVKEAGFHPNVRCCTVIPRVPNFLIGLGLLAGSAPLEAALERGLFLPEGLIISPRDLVKSLNYIVKPDRESPSVVCPFLELDSKRCGIYAFRTTTCSTFFCKKDRGEASEHFWSDFADFGSQVESALSQWALAEVGFDLAKYFQTLDELEFDTDEPWSSSVREKLYGGWSPRDLFRATAEVILRHKHELFKRASGFKPYQAKGFDARLRALLQDRLPFHLIDEALPLGEAESIASLWYQMQLSARNLQLAPKS